MISEQASSAQHWRAAWRVRRPAVAQTYPNRPVKIIVPFAPGGVDVIARLIADRLAAALGQPFVVENRPGGAGGIGRRQGGRERRAGRLHAAVQHARPARHQPGDQQERRLRPVKSFAPVAIVSKSPLMLVVHPSVPAKSVAELVAYAKANPGQDPLSRRPAMARSRICSARCSRRRPAPTSCTSLIAARRRRSPT